MEIALTGATGFIDSYPVDFFIGLKRIV